MRLALFCFVIGLAARGVAAQPELDRKALHAMCAAANAILATQMEPGMLADVVKNEARRHADAAKKWGATDTDLRQFVKATQLAYNDGRMSWAEIADLGESCVEVPSD
jgi:hypothetical protein